MKEYSNSNVLLVDGDCHKISHERMMNADFVFQKKSDGTYALLKNRIGPIGEISETPSNKISKDDLIDRAFSFMDALDRDFNKLKTLVEFVDFCFEKKKEEYIDDLGLAG